jgi:hypothetical protein
MDPVFHSAIIELAKRVGRGGYRDNHIDIGHFRCMVREVSFRRVAGYADAEFSAVMIDRRESASNVGRCRRYSVHYVAPGTYNVSAELDSFHDES